MRSYLIRMRSGKPGGGKGPLVQDEVSGTLACGNDQTLVAFAQNTRDEVRVQGDGTLSGALAASAGMKQTTYVAGASTVRRLTPTECERLQGFPDGWTQIAYRGKAAGECPDGPRYKALGNSMAVPVMRWIGERIEMSERGEIR